MDETIQIIKDINRHSVDISDQWLNQLRYVRVDRNSENTDAEVVTPELIIVSIPDLANLHEAHPGPESPKFLEQRKTKADVSSDLYIEASNSKEVESTVGKHRPYAAVGPSDKKPKKSVVTSDIEEPSLAADDCKSNIEIGHAEFHNSVLSSEATEEERGPKTFRIANFEKNPAVELFVEKIVETYPSDPVVLMFVGTDDHPRSDSICAKIAGAFAAKNIGSVLLIDGNVRRPRLTMHESYGEEKGFTDLLHSNSQVVEPQNTQVSNLDFVPRGLSNYSMFDAEPNKISEIATLFRKRYRFTCLNVGCYTDVVARHWGQYCDSTFLILSLDETEQVVAIEAAESLRQSGSRLTGAIATKDAA